MDVWAPYCGTAPSPSEVWGRWNLDPILLVVLGVGLGLGLLAGPWRTSSPRLAPLAVAVLAISFVSPLCALSSALFTARTAHHLLLVLGAAPLIAWTLPARRGSPRLGSATIVQTAVFWAWHAPSAYAAALSSDAVYWLMQISLLVTAVWFWTEARAARFVSAVAALLFATVQMGLLGAVLTFSSLPLYAPHLLTTAAFGLSPVEDQQMAGLIMWVPAAGAYLVAALVILSRNLSRMEEARA